MGSATRSRSHRDTGPVSSVSKQLVKAERTVPATGSPFLCPFQQENAFLSFHSELGGPSTESPCTTAFHLLITPPSRALSLLSGEGMAYGAVLPGAQRPPRLCLADGGLEGLGVAVPVQEGRAVAAQPVTCSLWTHPRGGAHVHTSCAPSSGVIGPPKESVPSLVILRVGARIFEERKVFSSLSKQPPLKRRGPEVIGPSRCSISCPYPASKLPLNREGSFCHHVLFLASSSSTPEAPEAGKKPVKGYDKRLL